MIKNLYRFFSGKFQNIFLDYPVEMRPRYTKDSPHPLLLEIIENGRSEYKAQIASFNSYLEDLSQVPFEKNSAQTNLPHWNNGFLPGMDIIVLYGMIASLKPKRYMEVGSGNSTKVVHLAKTKYSPGTEITSIDPMPRAEIDQLADKVIRKPFESINLECIHQLEAGDVLFIDNSHRIFPNSDAMVFFMEVLPRLKKGVIVHLHDIYLPYDYPQFMCDRAYSEQYGLASFLLSNPKKYCSLFPNYFVSQDKELASGFEPFWKLDNIRNAEKHGGSFWLLIGE
jgi:predicted O-methyltransferase YrrM